jgi:hypothetical protein
MDASWIIRHLESMLVQGLYSGRASCPAHMCFCSMDPVKPLSKQWVNQSKECEGLDCHERLQEKKFVDCCNRIAGCVSGLSPPSGKILDAKVADFVGSGITFGQFEGGHICNVGLPDHHSTEGVGVRSEVKYVEVGCQACLNSNGIGQAIQNSFQNNYNALVKVELRGIKEKFVRQEKDKDRVVK